MYLTSYQVHRCLYQYLSKGVKNQAEVSYGCDRGKSLLIHVTSLLNEPAPNVVIS